MPPPADSAIGRETLKEVLEAWAKGRMPADLKQGSPAILVSDPDWEGGQQLLEFKIDPEEDRSGVDLQLTATLTLKNKAGQTVRKPATYVIATGARTTVLRNDPDN
jgi:hypothetical protein